MKLGVFVSGAALAVFAAAGLAGVAVAQRKLTPVAASTDWSKRASITDKGAYVLGNPKAKVRLIEYVSYTCSHCAHFVGEAEAPLKRDYVSRGTAAIELRHAVRDPFDYAATLLARCGGPDRFFGNTEAIMAAQSQWLAKAESYQGPRAASVDDGLRAVTKAVGLDKIMLARGFTAQQIDACLVDDVQQKTLGAMTEASFARIKGTPSFEINGTVLDGVHDWASLEPQLKAAAAR